MTAVYIILAIIALFVLVLIFNTVRVSISARKLGEYKYWKSEEEQKEYAERLSEMIRCKTVSVDGSYDDTEFSKLRETVKKLFPTVHEKAEIKIFSDDCWIYKIEGRNKNRNIMLMSHHDVVKADGEWEQPPFEGKIVDGKLWGRGTVDTKTPLFAEFSALEELLNKGFVPETNLYIGSSHNEELGGDGIPLAIEFFKKEGITFELVLDEGGAVISPPLAGMKCRCAMLAVHEKGRHTLICRAEQGNTHTGLNQQTETPVVRMSKFIAEVQGKNLFIRKMYPEVKEMFKALCPYMPLPLKLVFANLWCFEPLLVKLIPSINAQAGSMLGTTCAFNGIKGGKYDGQQTNYCESTAFLRCVNDADQQKDIEKIKAVAEKYGVDVCDAPTGNEYYKPADMTKAPFAYVRSIAGTVFPAVAVSPFILPAGTDARHMTDICDCVVRFAPIDIDDQQFKSVHSENENINLTAIGNAVEFYTQFIQNYK